MRILPLSKSGTQKIRSLNKELRSSDFEVPVKSLVPGEWCFFKTVDNTHYVGFVNPLIEDKFSCAHCIESINFADLNNFEVEDFIRQRIKNAIFYRHKFLDYESCARIFYGISDGLPGLIVDEFENAVVIQINTAGVDRYRSQIKQILESETRKKTFFLDNPKYREKEMLPIYPVDELPDLEVRENGLKFLIRSEVVQKVGFYFDHRENRYYLINLLRRLSVKPKKGLDLFCYVGAWGISAMKAGVLEMEFVDQGDFSIEVEKSMTLNELSKECQFRRQDVFRFLDESISKQLSYDLVLSDPPAFAKNPLQKNQALEGYTKLHRKVFKVLSKESLVAFSSCTHYVGHDEFQKNILDAAYKEKRKIKLLYAGIQGFDHPIVSLDDRSNYIKSYFYYVE